MGSLFRRVAPTLFFPDAVEARMAHEVNDKTARKRELDMENGKPVDANDEDDEDERKDND